MKALTFEEEMGLTTEVTNMVERHELVSMKVFRKMATDVWNKSHLLTTVVKFKASNGWISNFCRNNKLSFQTVSMRASPHNQKKLEDCGVEVTAYREEFWKFVLINGMDFVFNFDETVSGGLNGRIQTIAPKNMSNQPCIKNKKVDRGFSIGCLVTATGRKLPPMLVGKGTTPKSMEKYKDYVTDKRCIMDNSSSGWFNESHILTVLAEIYSDTQGAPSLCIWDEFSAHKTPKVRLAAKSYNITLLFVPSGLTGILQPLDVQFNGPYKSAMNSDWLIKKHNETRVDFHINLCETAISCYYAIPEKTIIGAFIKCFGED